MLYETARGIDRDPADTKTAHAQCSMVKLYCSEMAGRVADRAVQVFGGRGYMRENVAERFFRELRVERIWEGTQRDPADDHRQAADHQGGRRSRLTALVFATVGDHAGSRSCLTAGRWRRRTSVLSKSMACLAGGKAACGDLFGGGAEEAEDGGGEPGGGERAVKFAGALASPDEPFQPDGASVVLVVVAGRIPGEGGAE